MNIITGTKENQHKRKKIILYTQNKNPIDISSSNELSKSKILF